MFSLCSENGILLIRRKSRGGNFVIRSKNRLISQCLVAVHPKLRGGPCTSRGVSSFHERWGSFAEDMSGRPISDWHSGFLMASKKMDWLSMKIQIGVRMIVLQLHKAASSGHISLGGTKCFPAFPYCCFSCAFLLIHLGSYSSSKQDNVCGNLIFSPISRSFSA